MQFEAASGGHFSIDEGESDHDQEEGDHQAQGQHNVGCAADALALLHLSQPAKERKKDQLIKGDHQA